jgi:Glycosyl hydrolase family 26
MNSIGASIYNFYKRNIRIIYALFFLSLIISPIINQVIKTSKSTPFFGIPTSYKQASKTLKLDKLNYGVLDKSDTFKDNEDITFDQSYITWETTYEQNNLVQAVTKAQENNRTPIINLEPWQLFKEQAGEDYLNKISEGKYDGVISNFCDRINRFNQTVLVSFGQQPDLGYGYRYSWSVDNGEVYKKAFRRWHDTCSSRTNKVIYIWSIEGNEKSMEYYPGDEYVNFIGISMLYQTVDKTTDQTKIEQIAKDYVNGKFKFIDKLNKFVYLLDYGVDAPKESKKIWFDTILGSALENKKILGVICINIESKVLDYTNKDGIVTKQIIEKPADYRLQKDYLPFTPKN